MNCRSDKIRLRHWRDILEVEHDTLEAVLDVGNVTFDSAQAIFVLKAILSLLHTVDRPLLVQLLFTAYSGMLGRPRRR